MSERSAAAAKYPQTRSETCSDTAGVPCKGKVQWFFWISQSEIALSLQSAQQKDEIETLEECLNTYKQTHTQYVVGEKGKWWNMKNKTALAFPMQTHTPPFPPSWFPYDSWGITCLTTLICLKVPKLFSPPIEQQTDCFSPQAGDIHSGLGFIWPMIAPPATTKPTPHGSQEVESSKFQLVCMAKNGIWFFEDVAQRWWITVTSNHKLFFLLMQQDLPHMISVLI